jgi:hypothetical protein
LSGSYQPFRNKLRAMLFQKIRTQPSAALRPPALCKKSSAAPTRLIISAKTRIVRHYCDSETFSMVLQSVVCTKQSSTPNTFDFCSEQTSEDSHSLLLQLNINKHDTQFVLARLPKLSRERPPRKFFTKIAIISL